jgi:glycosyltransferase involved in cell wall biosynthesis
MNATDANFAVVMPVYEDQEASTRLFRELFAEYGTRAYVVAVDDGSINQPVQIEALQSAGVKGVVITLKRNVGHQRAIAIGLNYVAEHFPDMPCTIVMDSDGEDTPQSIRYASLAACASSRLNASSKHLALKLRCSCALRIVASER